MGCSLRLLFPSSFHPRFFPFHPHCYSLSREKAHSRYFGEAAYKYMVEGKAEGYNFIGKPNPVPENKQMLIIPEASHCDLYDGGYTEPVGKGEPKNMIPWDKLAAFFNTNLK